MLLVLADGSKFPPHVILYHIRMSTEQLHRVPVVRCEHKDWVEGLVGVEQRARGWQSLMQFRDMHHQKLKSQLLMGPWTQALRSYLGRWPTTAGAKCSGEETIKIHLEHLYGEWLLTRGHVVTPAGRIKKPSVTISLSVDHNSMAERPSRSDCKGSSRAQWMELMMICCGMALKRKMKALTVKMETVILIGKCT